MRRLRYHLTYLVSAGLMVVAATSIVTGLVAHLWDLNEFTWHIRSGYVMTGLVLLHVALGWPRLVNYAKARTRRGGSRTRTGSAARLSPRSAAAGPRPAAARPAAAPASFAAGRPAGHEPSPTGRHPAPASAPRSRRWVLTAGVAGVAAPAGFLAGRGLRGPPVIPQGSDVGVLYHQWSKPGIIDALGTLANWGEQPELYKRYPQAPWSALPRPALTGGLTVERSLAVRRSTREYAARPMSLADLGRLLWLTGGRRQQGQTVRTAPSSGALYPVEVYPVVHAVDGLQPGVYHYDVERHGLSLVRPGDHRAAVVRQSLQQEFLGECAVVLVLTVVFQRMRFKYQDRTYRYGLLEAGHLGQNAYLAATSAGLGACGVGAFLDDEINAMLGVDGVEEVAAYLLAAGPVAPAA